MVRTVRTVRRVPRGWCLVPFALVGATVLTACGMRKPPTACEWVDASPPASLIDDIKKAEDLSIRHGDAHPYGAVRRDARERCEAKLFAAIADARRIGVDDVRRARLQLNDRAFDWTVNFPMAIFTLLAATVLLRKVGARFPDDRAARVVAVLLLSIGLGILVVGVGQVWAFAVEGVRIGNDHLGYRGLRIPWGKHWLATFALTMVSTWILAVALGTRHPAPGTNP